MSSWMSKHIDFVNVFVDAMTQIHLVIHLVAYHPQGWCFGGVGPDKEQVLGPRTSTIKKPNEHEH